MDIREPKFDLVGVYGGTFDPIHLAHLSVAKEILDIVGMIRMLLIPSAQPPHRSGPKVSASHRLEMVRIAVAGLPMLIPDGRELSRKGPSYAVDTLRELYEEVKDNEALCFVMGMDAFSSLDSWYQWQSLFDYCHIIVAQRPGCERKMSDTLRSFAHSQLATSSSDLKKDRVGRILFVEQAPMDLSSTKIRSQLEQARSSELLLPPGVEEYIRRNNLYLNE